MEIARQSIYVSTELPVQFSANINGADVTIYNVQIAGLTSMFDNLPEAAKIQIINKCARHARGIK
jgi:hypothetical protein